MVNRMWASRWRGTVLGVSLVAFNVAVGLTLGLSWWTVVGVGGTAFFAGACWQLGQDWYR